MDDFGISAILCFVYFIDFNHNRLKTKKETDSRDGSKYNQRKETTRCPNDIDTQILLMWNSF